jgi:hypothetical protein
MVRTGELTWDGKIVAHRSAFQVTDELGVARNQAGGARNGGVQQEL